MSTEQPETTPAPEGTEEKEPQWYRDQIAAEKAKTEELQKELNRQRVRLMESSFEKIGLDPNKGIGKAVAKHWEGDPDPAKILEYAVEEWDFEPPPEVGTTHPLAGDISAGQGRVSAAVGTAASNPTEQIDLDIAQAEERGDFATTMALKVQKFRQDQGI